MEKLETVLTVYGVSVAFAARADANQPLDLQWTGCQQGQA